MTMPFAYAYPCAVISAWLPIVLLTLLLLAYITKEIGDVRQQRLACGQR